MKKTLDFTLASDAMDRRQQQTSLYLCENFGHLWLERGEPLVVILHHLIDFREVRRKGRCDIANRDGVRPVQVVFDLNEAFHFKREFVSESFALISEEATVIRLVGGDLFHSAVLLVFTDRLNINPFFTFASSFSLYSNMEALLWFYIPKDRHCEFWPLSENRLL